MFLIRRPDAALVTRWLGRQAASPLPPLPARETMRMDHNRARLANGEGGFRRARAAVARWEMFRLGWAEIVPATPPLAIGTTVGILVRHFGLWSLNPCRIVALLDEAGAVERFGFVYRTLGEHAVAGEERFAVEWTHADDTVAYDLTAWSRPRHALARLGGPMARLVQRRFARDSLAAMRRAVGA